MFAYLKGLLAEKNTQTVVVECNGVGYELLIPLKTFDNLPQIGKKVKLYVYSNFNENDGTRLFGFSSREEKILFIKLISVSKIGPKTALSVLSTLSVNDFVQAIELADVNLISTVHGLGKKSSERLIVELQDKLSKLDLISTTIDKKLISNNIFEEAESALKNLGYKRSSIRKTISRLLKKKEYQSSEKLIKAAIKNLYNKN